MATYLSIGDPFMNRTFEKSLTMPKKTQRWGPLVSPGIVCYAEKRKNLFGSVR